MSPPRCYAMINVMQGGLKAVVWTDTLQTILMFMGVVIVMILGTAHVGGLGVVFDRSAQSGRLEFFK
jgi:Na+/proline symporter